MLIKWQMALMSSHSNPSQEGIDINTTDFPPLSHPQVITAPTVGMTPASGDYYELMDIKRVLIFMGKIFQ